MKAHARVSFLASANACQGMYYEIRHEDVRAHLQ